MFRDVKVCKNLVTDEIDDHRIQSDYKCTSGLQNPEGKNSTLGICVCVVKPSDKTHDLEEQEGPEAGPFSFVVDRLPT